MVGLEQMTQQHTEVVLCDIAEIAQRQHARCQFGWHHLTIGSQCGHGLMIKQAVGQTASARRLHPFLFQIELHQGDALQQLPGYGLRQQGTGLSGILTYHKPHLRRGTAAARTAHALQKRRHGVGCIYLKRTLQPTDIDAQFKRRSGTNRHHAVVALDNFLSTLAISSRQIAMVDEETVGLMPGLTVLAERGSDGLTLFS